jgi:hypothetical protein
MTLRMSDLPSAILDEGADADVLNALLENV